MNHFTRFMLAVLLALASSISTFAYDFEVDGIFYNTLSLEDLTCEVTYEKYDNDYGYKSPYSGDFIVLSSVTYAGKTFKVTSIGEGAFYDCSSLTSVVLPNSVTSIGEGAFYNCSSLTSVVLPNSVTSIGMSAFYNCSSLTSIVLPNSVTSIGNGAFRCCSSLTSIVLPNSVTLIDAAAFENCTSLTSVVLPDFVTSIGPGVFYNCSSLTSIVLPNSVTSIGNGAFAYCTSLTSIVLPNSVISISKNAFAYCTSLTSIVLPNSVTSIGDYMFYNCSSLASIVLPNSVTSIGEGAFYNCSSLTSIVLPNSVTSIGYSAFENCTRLKEITSLNTTPPRIKEYAFEGVSKPECLVKVPDEAVDAYKSADYWKEFWNIVGLDEEPGEEPELKCEEPTISLVGEKIVALSATKGSKCYTSITSDDFKGYDGVDPIDLCGVYKISSYAHADGYQNSETVTALLVWVNPELREDDSANIMQMDVRKAVVISINGNSLQISGTERGEAIQLYSVDGMLLESLSAGDGNTTIPYTLTKGDTYIIRYGDKTVKYRY